MALDGERVISKVSGINNNPMAAIGTVNIPANPLPGCCSDMSIKVLANTSSDTSENDVNTIIYLFEKITTSATMSLKKWVNNAWAVQATISDSTYGTYSSLGAFSNKSGQKIISLKLEWAAVLAAFGEGSYKVSTVFVVPVFGSDIIDSAEFCLKTYSPANADNTVKLEYWLSGQIGDIKDDAKVKDFGSLSVYNSLRLNGVFGYPKASYKEEDVKYDSGQAVFVEDEQEPVFKLKLLLLPFFIHEILRTEFMQANRMAITDFNSKNAGIFKQKFIRKNSGYDPEWYPLQSNFANVELEFTQEFNNFRKFR